ncbi:MAG: sigma 54-interacting transcriptional regulator [Erysipelotrichaceae bacterium]
MLRKSKLLAEIKKECAKYTRIDISNGIQGVNAQFLSNLLSMDRANISKDLNQLVIDKEIIRVQGRPVYYFPREQLEKLIQTEVHKFEVSSLLELLNYKDDKNDNFEHVIGNDSSLKEVIKKAKAAMIYPPFGIHTLLIGPTGVGKTMFAEIMFSYGKNKGILNTDGKFVVFNCAEYADNPQLLLGQLFGYEKGAYTGAETKSEGLVAKANGGVLFLDEIHRLPPEGQEMLFMLLDRGEYRRLGSHNEVLKAKILVIAATTENIESSLLHTFIRRIPMTINMPPLADRSLKERFDLIEKFFSQEYTQMNVPIYVKDKVIKALLSYECVGNIGQLKADIRLLCANGFLEYKSKNLKEIRISSKLLQDNVYRGLINIKNKKELNSLFKNNNDYFVYNQKKVMQEFDEDIFDIYQIINQRYDEYEKQGLNEIDANQHIKKYLEEYIKGLSTNTLIEDNDGIFKIVPLHVYNVAEVSLQIASQKLKCKYSKKIIVALSLHLLALIENKRPQKEINKNIQEIVKEHPNEYMVAKEIRIFIEKELEITLKEQELLFITMFLYIDNDNKNKTLIGLLVLAHGNGVARNMVDVANTLLQTNHAHALDMSLIQNVNEFLEIVEKKIKEIDEGNGVLLLVDMGSLVSFGDIISKRSGIKIKTLDMVSTAFVLESLRKIILSQDSLETLFCELQTQRIHAGDININSKNQRYAIITTCITGEGAAVKLGELIRSTISIVNEYEIEIICCNSETFRQKDITEKKIIGVVGAIDLHLEDVPYISSDKIILEDGLKTINELITNAIGIESNNEVIPNFLVNNFLKETLVFLDPIKANKVIRESFEIISKMYKIQDYNRVLIGYMLHVGCMIERSILKEQMEYDNYQEHITEDEELFHVIETAFKIIEDEFQINISDEEKVYVMDIFNTQ